jgi:hypothetical protein
MALEAMLDISFIDIDELGVRPRDWTDNHHGMDFDEQTRENYSQHKWQSMHEFHRNKYEQIFDMNEMDTNMSSKVDCSTKFNYQIDPETGTIKYDHMLGKNPCLSFERKLFYGHHRE